MLNKSLPFGTVHGDDTKGVAFYQNGKHFNHEGYEVDFNTGKRIEKIAPPAPKEPDEGDGDGDDETEIASTDLIVDNINLSAVARGEDSSVPASKVKKAVEKHFGVKTKDLAQAIQVINGEEIA